MFEQYVFNYANFKKKFKFLFLAALFLSLATDSFCVKRKHCEEDALEKTSCDKRKKEDESSCKEKDSVIAKGEVENENLSEFISDQKDDKKSKFFKFLYSGQYDKVKSVFLEIAKKAVEKGSSAINFILNKNISSEDKINIIKGLLIGQGQCGYKLNCSQLDWSVILDKDIEIIKFFADSGQYFDDPTSFSVFYEDFSQSFVLLDKEKILQLVEIFSDKDVNWIDVFNRYLYQVEDYDKDVIALLKDKYLNFFKNTNKFKDSAFEAGHKSDSGVWDINSFYHIEYDMYELENIIGKDKRYLSACPIFSAICSKSLSKVKLLVEEFAADVNACCECKKPKFENQDTFFSKQKFYDCSPEKVIENDLEEIYDKKYRDSFLNEEVRVLEGFTPLHLACSIKKSEEMVKYLLEKGAKIDTKDCFSRTPLFIAILNENIECAKILIEYGADLRRVENKSSGLFMVSKFKDLIEAVVKKYGINITDSNGRSLLHYACLIGGLNPKFFIQKSIDKNIQDSDGNCPLHIACSKRSFNKAKVIIESGASIKLENKKGQTPLDILCSKEDISIDLMNMILRDCTEKNKDGKNLFPKVIKESRSPVIEKLRKALMADEKFDTPENWPQQKTQFNHYL